MNEAERKQFIYLRRRAKREGWQQVQNPSMRMGMEAVWPDALRLSIPGDGEYFQSPFPGFRPTQVSAVAGYLVAQSLVGGLTENLTVVERIWGQWWEEECRYWLTAPHLSQRKLTEVLALSPAEFEALWVLETLARE